MDANLTTTICFILSRAIHFGSCFLIMGVWTFDRLVVARSAEAGGPIPATVVVRSWQRIARWLLLVALPAALISGAAWFALVAIDMSGLPASEALTPATLKSVLFDTQFGAVWRWRSAFWLASVPISGSALWLPLGSRARSWVIWIAALCGTLLLGSLAWAGHGCVGEPARWHVLADALHLAVSAIWPTGLLPLLLLLLAQRNAPADEAGRLTAALVHRFSAMSLAAVTLLVVTGMVNSCYMLASISDLFHSSYGQALLVKIGLFLVALALGGVNLLYLKPRICAPHGPAFGEMKKLTFRLRRTVGAELALGTALVVVLALLGLLSPPRV